MSSPPLTRRELERYIPNFDPLLDPQIGEWVLVVPQRRSIILGPLLQLLQERAVRPIYPFLTDETSSANRSLATSPFEEEPPSKLPELSSVFPTLEEVWRRYRRSRFHIPDMAVGAAGGDEEDDDTILYLNARALLLTPCAPEVFGGSDFIEGLDRETGRVVFVNWKTGESRTDPSALKTVSIPTWARGVTEKAAAEWELWRQRSAGTPSTEGTIRGTTSS